MDGMSISDALALRNDGGAMGGGSWLWFVIIIFLLGGNGGFGYGGYGGAMAQGISNEFLYSNLASDINQTRQSVINTQNGLADSTWSINNTLGNLRYEMAQNINGINGSICGLKADMNAGFCQMGNTMHNETQRIIDLINANTQQSLRDQLADVKLEKSQILQNAYLVDKLAPAAP